MGKPPAQASKVDGQVVAVLSRVSVGVLEQRETEAKQFTAEHDDGHMLNFGAKGTKSTPPHHSSAAPPADLVFFHVIFARRHGEFTAEVANLWLTLRCSNLLCFLRSLVAMEPTVGEDPFYFM